MKIKIIEPGYAGFTGLFGAVMFQDAVSVDHVAPWEINMISAILMVVDADTDKEVGSLALQTSTMDSSASAVYYPTLADIQAGVRLDSTPTEVAGSEISTVYSQIDLERIADRDGIAGLRFIADPLGVKATSIVKLIEGIMLVQTDKTEAPAEAPAEV